jgi:hypothetical protein
MEDDIKKALDGLEDEKVEVFNRSKMSYFMCLEYFQNNDSATPSNTPSGKKAADVTLTTVNFDKFLNMQNGYESYTSNNFKMDLTFCETTCIGNAKCEVGISQNGQKMICNNLLCSKCDIKVSTFKNKKWNDSCDYMFFRNNYGDQIKLSEVTYRLINYRD